MWVLGHWRQTSEGTVGLYSSFFFSCPRNKAMSFSVVPVVKGLFYGPKSNGVSQM